MFTFYVKIIQKLKKREYNLTSFRVSFVLTYMMKNIGLQKSKIGII